MTTIRAPWKLVSHAAVVLAFTVLYAVLWFFYVEAPDAGPLSGMSLFPAYVPLALLGLPFSAVLLIAGNDLGVLVLHVLALAPAWVNVGIHALMTRSRRRSSDPVDSRPGR